MTHSTFGERFGYALWLAHLTTGEVPSYADIGRRVGRTGPAVGGWIAAEEPPPDYKVHEPLASYLGIGEDWLVKARGAVPHPELWHLWIEHRRRQPPVEIVPKPEPELPGANAYFAAQDKKKAARRGGQQKKGKAS